MGSASSDGNAGQARFKQVVARASCPCMGGWVCMRGMVLEYIEEGGAVLSSSARALYTLAKGNNAKRGKDCVGKAIVKSGSRGTFFLLLLLVLQLATNSLITRTQTFPFHFNPSEANLTSSPPPRRHTVPPFRPLFSAIQSPLLML